MRFRAGAAVWNFGHSCFEFVSNFEIRISKFSQLLRYSAGSIVADIDPLQLAIIRSLPNA